MQLPQKDAAYPRRVRFGRYVARRLRRAKQAQMAADARAATDRIKAAGRALEDLEDDFQDHYAERDACDDANDQEAKAGRHSFEGRSLDATRTEPYTLIYTLSLDYYTAAPIDESAHRYRDLIERLRKHLPEGDPLRDSADRLEVGVQAYEAALTAVETHQRLILQAATELASAERAFDILMDKIYSALRGQLGAKAADRFFPRQVKRRK